MKIFQVINVRWFNATAWYALYLSQLLQKEGHDVVVITEPGTACDAKAQEMGLRTVPINLNSANPAIFGPAAKQVIQLLRKEKPDVVNCHRGEGFFFWGFLKKLGFKFKLIRTRGDQRLPKSDFLNRWLHAEVADAVVTTNRRMAEHFLSKMKTPEQNVWLVHGGVDTETYHYDRSGRDRVRKEFGYSEKHFVVGLLGRFDKVKGQRELIESVSILYHKRNYKNIRLCLIGFETATKEREVYNWLKRFNIEEITTITGKRNDISACISALDLGVVPSLWSEAIARAALEIMACERPLISSNVNVLPDLVPSQGVFRAGDLAVMTKLIQKAIDSSEYREQLLDAHGRIMSQMTGEDFMRRTLNLYQSALEKA
ncbi:MAG: glycosyltransferase family 4 protein [Desulfovibrio sp.]